MAVLYYGTVVKVSGDKVYATIPALGGNLQFGPLPVLASWYMDKYQVDTDPGGGEMVDTERQTYYKKGDRVVIGQIGKVKEDLVVLGAVK